MKKSLILFLMCFLLTECARVDNRQEKTRLRLPRGEVLENLFNIYDASFLSVVWPKITNGKHLFLDPACWTEVGVFLKDLAVGKAWAYSAVDASGRYQSGLFNGHRFWLGSKEQCLKLDKNYVTRDGNGTLNEFRNDDYLNNVLRKEKYFDGGMEEWRSLVARDELMRRLVTDDNAPPQRLAFTVLQIQLNITKVTMAKSYDITLGVCLPRSCSLDDVASIINFSIIMNDNFKSNKTLPRALKVTSLRRVEEYYDVFKDTGAMLLLSVTLVLLTIAVIATIVDLKLMKCGVHNSNSMSFDIQKINNDVKGCTTLDKERNHSRDILARKESNIVDMETLTINNINNSNNINLVTVKKVTKTNALPPSITLDVVSMERVTGSCKRCGKYKKQCNANHLRRHDNLTACPRVKSFASMTDYRRKNRFFRTLLLCFSLRYSWKRIFNTNTANKNLALVHLLKIAATFWIIFIHVAMITDYISEDSGDINEYNSSYYVLITGTLAFDTLFFVSSVFPLLLNCSLCFYSGLFSSNHFFYLKSQYTVEELVSFGGTCGEIMQFVCFVTNRAIRILPSYAYAIFLTAVMARVSSHTYVLSLPENDDTNCDRYWWRNLLYISNAFPRDQQCMQISWLMSTETQLHVACSLACVLAACGRRAAAALAAAAAIVATAADITASYMFQSHYLSDIFAAYFTYIEHPMARVAPYFIGVFTGWLLHRLDGKLHISKLKSSCLWLVTVIGICGSLALPSLVHPWMVSWLHLLWPVAILWPVLVFSTNFSSVNRRILQHSAVVALSRLCGCAILLHGVCARSLLLEHTATAQPLCLWSYTAGAGLLTALGAVTLSLLVEMPSCTLLRRLSDYIA